MLTECETWFNAADHRATSCISSLRAIFRSIFGPGRRSAHVRSFADVRFQVG